MIVFSKILIFLVGKFYFPLNTAIEKDEKDKPPTGFEPAICRLQVSANNRS